MLSKGLHRELIPRLYNSTLVRHNSTFDQLIRSKPKVDNSANVKDINDLLNSSFESDSSTKHFKSKSDWGLDVIPHPRDVARNIKIQGPSAGRVADVNNGQLTRAIAQINRTVKANKIRYLQKIQARHIPRGKLKKQKKREWWRKKFSEGYKDLMAQVANARRRGY